MASYQNGVKLFTAADYYVSCSQGQNVQPCGFEMSENDMNFSRNVHCFQPSFSGNEMQASARSQMQSQYVGMERTDEASLAHVQPNVLNDFVQHREFGAASAAEYQSNHDYSTFQGQQCQYKSPYISPFPSHLNFDERGNERDCFWSQQDIGNYVDKGIFHQAMTYQKMPQGSNRAGSMSVPKRSRTVFQPHQIRRLQHEFECEMYMVGMKRKKLSKELDLTEKQIKIWFQNKRMKQKRERTRKLRHGFGDDQFASRTNFTWKELNV